MNLRRNTLRCEQCGREGSRGFTTIGDFKDDRYGLIPPITLCSNKNACRKRWPNESMDDE